MQSKAYRSDASSLASEFALIGQAFADAFRAMASSARFCSRKAKLSQRCGS